MAGCSYNWKDNDEIKKEHEENDGNEDEFGMEFEEEEENISQSEDDDENEPDFLDENTGKIWTFKCQIQDEQHLEELCQEMGGIMPDKEEKLTLEFYCPVQDCPLQAIFLKSHSLLYTRNEHKHGMENDKETEKQEKDYVDREGKFWPFCVKIGKNISTEIFRTEFGFSRVQNRQSTINLYCQKKGPNGKRCPFSGIYSKANGCLYTKGKHEHPKIEVFKFYNNSGQLWLLTAKYGFLSGLCVLGIFLNSAMVYVTIKTKSMHNRCNVIIALSSLFYIPLLFGMSVKYILLQIGTNFIPLLHCYYIQLFPLFSTSMASSMQICIGVDRLISVLFPIWYMTRDRCKTFWAVFIPCFIRALWITYLFNTAANLHPEKMVMCSSSELVQPEIQAPIQISATIMNLIIFGCYVLIWLVIACKKLNGADQQIDVKKRKLIKSLTVLIAITLFGYIQTTLWRSILAYVHFDAIDVENYVIYPTLCLYIISDSSNAPVLYLFSTEYKAAFKKQLGWMVGIPENRSVENKSNRLRTITMNMNQNYTSPYCDRLTLVTMRQIVEARTRNAQIAMTRIEANE